MCDTRTRTLIQHRTSRFITQEEVFTAYDVTIALRREGRIVRHDDVRRIVHAMWTLGYFGAAYFRDIVTFPRSEHPSCVFHPYNRMPSEHPLFRAEEPACDVPGCDSGAAALYRLIVSDSILAQLER